MVGGASSDHGGGRAVTSTAAERSTHALATLLALIVLFGLWQPTGGVVRQVDNKIGRTLPFAGLALGWLPVLAAVLLVIHSDLFGLRQVWLHFRGQRLAALNFNPPGPYRLVCPPVYQAGPLDRPR